jgi:hypothetical protein
VGDARVTTLQFPRRAREDRDASHKMSVRNLTTGTDVTHASRVVNAPPQVPWTRPASGEGTTAPQAGGDWGAETPRSGIAPGELKIKERVSWSTLQLVLAAAGTLVVGMFLGSCFPTGGSRSATSTGAGTPRPLPAESAPGGTSSASSGGAVTGTSVPPTQRPTTAANGGGSAPATTSAAGPLVVLLGPKQSQGVWTSTPFTVKSGQWNIGWAFRCTPSTAPGDAFQVFVVPTGGSPGSTPAVSQSGGSGQSVTVQSSTGSQELMVRAPGNCIWAVKVTGSS